MSIRRVPVVGAAEAGRWAKPTDTVTIPLSRGLLALVDRADAAWLNEHRWYAVPMSNGRGYYAVRQARGADGKVRRVWMHRQIIQPAEGLVVDHANGDGLDNRRANLRACTVQQNVHNRRLRREDWRGVTKTPAGFVAVLSLGKGRKTTQGPFATAREAAEAYDAMALAERGDFAVLNFARPERLTREDEMELEQTAAAIGVSAPYLRDKWRSHRARFGLPAPHAIDEGNRTRLVWSRSAIEAWFRKARKA